MKPKTGLNNTQRKILEEIYVGKIKAVVEDYKDNRNRLRSDLIDEVNISIKSDKRVLAIAKKRNEYADLLDKYQQSLLESGIVFNSDSVYGDFSANAVRKFNVKLTSRYDNSHPTLEKFDKETNEKLSRLDDVRQEARAKIWGLDTSYEEIENEVKELLKGIV